VIDLQTQTDEKSLIGKLHRNIVSLQLKEHENVHKMATLESKLSRLQKPFKFNIKISQYLKLFNFKEPIPLLLTYRENFLQPKKFMQGSSEKYCMYEKTSKNWIIEEFIKENTCTTHLGNCCFKNTFYLQNNELFPFKNWIDLD